MTTQAPPKKRRSFLRGCLIVVGVLVLLGALAQAFGSGTTTSNTTAGQSGAVTSPGSSAAAVDIDPSAAPVASAAAPATSADVNKGITFGEPVTFSAGGLNTVGVLATNTTDQVKSFTVKATYKTGEQIAATAVGAVNDLAPGQTRAVSLVSQEAIPANTDSVRVDVDTMIREAASTSGAEVAQKLQFGPPNVKATSGLSTVDVEVTNNDVAAHSLTVQATFTQGGKLVGIGSGAVNDLAPGQTKTATLIVQGQAEGAEVQIAADTIVQ